MKIVKEHIIFEKFREESDPIEDMGIGLFVNRDFDTKEEAYDFYDQCMLKFNHDYNIEFI